MLDGRQHLQLRHNTSQLMDDLDTTVDRYMSSLVKLHVLAGVMRIALGEDAAPQHLNLVDMVEHEFKDNTRRFEQTPRAETRVGELFARRVVVLLRKHEVLELKLGRLYLT